MHKIKSFVKNYWSYYLKLEDKFLETLNYVEFDSINFKTYSFEYLNLLLSVCSEIDVVGKMMAHYKNQNFKEDDTSNNIYKWWYEIQNSFFLDIKKLDEQEAIFLDKKLLFPWKNFKIEIVTNKKGSKYHRLLQSPKSKTPPWWKAYNAVKHNRTKRIDETNNANYTEANLANVANAFAGLYILEHAFIKSLQDGKYIKLIAEHRVFSLDYPQKLK